MNLDMTMFHQAFFEEASDLLTDFEAQLLKLEGAPDDPEILNTIFRCAHSIKGSSATFGFSDVAHFTHSLETLLDKVRNHQVSVDSGLIQLLLESLDQMQALMSVARGEAYAAPDDASLLARIEAAAAGVNTESKPMLERALQASACEPTDNQSQCNTFEISVYPGPDTLRQGLDSARLIRELADAGEVQSITCDSSRLPHLRDMDPETSYFGWSVTLRTDRSDDDLRKIFDFIADESEISISLIDEIQVRFDAGPSIDTPPTPVESRNTDKGAQSPEASKNARSVAAQTSTAGTDTHTLRVSTEKVDKLINLVGELVINQSMLNEVVQDFSMADLPRLMEAVEANERASRELQERVMGIRMLPIKHAFGRFPRLVRDMAGVIGKKIDLRMSGEETELDKTIIEAIGDPLTHLIRNSIDHGLESPSERHAVGKPETGVVSLNAFHEGGSIVIEVDDDGRGLNRDRILAKARERGLIADNDVPSDDAIYNIIFQPGFSTVTKVTDLSGRGVGMDIVRKAVQSMGGSVSLTSTPGKGTQFRIRLPLTMAILEGLSLGVGDETYIVPLTSIVESIQPKSSDVRHLANRAEVVMVRESVLPILRLYEAFQIAPRVTDPAQGLLVIVENDGRKAGLLADEIIGQSQVVIKSLEANYHKVNGIAGATIMGNGRVGLILDIPSLLREADSLGAAPIKEAA